MKRKLSVVLSLVCLFSLSSCKVDTDVIDKEVFIAVKHGSANEIACEQYIEYTKATYNSSSDVVLAVENGKADYGILDEFELNSYISNQRKIKETEQCEYSIDYCAYFCAENEELQNLFNDAIARLDSNGVLDEITNDYLKGESFLNSAEDNVNGTLTMLCDPSFENRVYTDDNGDVEGLDVDIAREICYYLGYDLEIVTTDFDELFTKLQAGEGDFIMSACEVSEEREEYYLLSDAYFTLNYHLIEKE